MMEATITHIRAIVGESKADVQAWCDLMPQVYFKNGKPYGLIAFAYGAKNTVHVATMTEHPDDPILTSMYKDILIQNKTTDIIVITDMPAYQQKVINGLRPHGFTFTYKDDIMYSYRAQTQTQRRHNGT